MQWIKNNVVLVVSALVSLLLIGGSGFYFYSQFSEEKNAEAELTTVKTTYDEYLNKEPSPVAENVEGAKEQQKRLMEFKARAEKFFPVFNTNTMSGDEFGAHLVAKLYELQRLTARANVQMPTNFSFSFTAQRELLQYDSTKTPIMLAQLGDVMGLCGALCDARVYEILEIRRAVASTNDSTAQPMNPTDYTRRRQITTNDVAKAIVLPYEIAFKGSSIELGVVLERLAHSSNGFIVKSVSVEPGDIKSEEEMQAAQENAVVTVGGGRMSAAMAARYGLGRRGGPAPPPAAAAPTAPAAPAPASKKTGIVLKERPLKITLMVDAVKLAP